ncbi:16S rRNA (cytidine(1402)-2'-O)-methyltransferase [Candidatus Microgenomates bacterium]|nr:MAG: 16S rRNA (cytidine(1402)-2'-O)-methyltransferase [Candidatus Microgenomates bacterium]
MGTLYLVATPIGNLQDITLRAIEILRKVEAVACEDTRKTGMLLKILQINTNTTNTTNSSIEIAKKPFLISYYEQNEFKRISEIINFLKNGKDLALVSDAGTPTVSDPGFKLVRECIKEGIKVESIPGPSSVISALVVSGLPTDKFLFVGYPPKKPGNREKFFQSINSAIQVIKTTVILFEAPHKLKKTLDEIKEIFGDMDIVICRELTKIHEEVRREKISESIAHFEKVNPKGEFVILFNLGEKRNLNEESPCLPRQGDSL